MCRLVVYKGRAVPICKLLLEPPHSLLKQSYEAREMLSGRLNADGFGIGWYQKALDPSPAIYTSTLPAWNDVNLPRMTNKIASDLIFGHVRGASDGMPVTSANTHPFCYKNFMFMHNGSVDSFRSKIYPEVTSFIDKNLWEHIKGNTDSEHIFGLWLSFLGISDVRPFTVEEQSEALRKTISFLETLADRMKIEMVLNLAISDGSNILATRHHFGSRKASLYFAKNLTAFPDSIIIASEKLNDDNDWKPIPERSLVTIEDGHIFRISTL